MQRPTAIHQNFLERRNQLREPVRDANALVDGRQLRIVNWSLNGLLLEGFPEPVRPGQRFSAAINLTTASGESFAFAAEARVVRRSPSTGRVGATYVCLDGAVAPRIVRHFSPFHFSQVAFAAEAVRPAGRVRDPEPEAAPDPEQPAGEPQDDSVRLADMLVAAREVAKIKQAFARRFHPDTAPRDESHAVRVQIFKEFWEVLEAAERRLRDGR